MLCTRTTLSVTPWRLFPDNYILVLDIPVLLLLFYRFRCPTFLINAVVVLSGILLYLLIVCAFHR